MCCGRRPRGLLDAREEADVDVRGVDLGSVVKAGLAGASGQERENSGVAQEPPR